MGECDHDFSNSPRYRFDPPPAPLQVRCAKCHIYVNVDESTPATPRAGEQIEHAIAELREMGVGRAQIESWCDYANDLADDEEAYE